MENDILHKIGQRIKKRASDCGISQEDLKNATGKSIDTIKKWYNGGSQIGLKDLITISGKDCLNCDLDYIVLNMEQTTHDNKSICENTGLSENALDFLRGMDPAHKKILNDLLSPDSGLTDILENVRLLRFYTCTDPENTTAADTSPGLSLSLLDLMEDSSTAAKKQRAIDNINRAKLYRLQLSEDLRTKINEMLKALPPVVPAAYKKKMDAVINNSYINAINRTKRS